jgi:signal transduction histidine kinase
VDEETNNLSPELSVNIFHIIQEGITNAIKHAQANQISIQVSILNSMVSTGGSRTIKVVIEDDGQGMQNGPMDTSGFELGLIGIRERALAFGGQMNVQTGLDSGVVLTVTIPLPESLR